MEYNNVARFRKKARMLRSELAAKSEVAESVIAKLEGTNSLSDVQTEEALAAVLEVPREKLFVRDISWQE